VPDENNFAVIRYLTFMDRKTFNWNLPGIEFQARVKIQCIAV
jgi:hypothetical protein